MPNWLDTAVRVGKQLLEANAERERGTGRTRKKSAPRTRRVEPGARIEYSPELDGEADPGEVVWTWVPYQDDPNRGKDRPVVIIGRTGSDLLGVPLTSKQKRRNDQIPVGSGAWDPRRRPSYAKLDRLLTIDPDDVRREGAILGRDRFDAVVAGLARHHDLVHP